MKKTALIMAGGRGERFWPRSRKSCPKQFLSLTNDGETMIQQAVKRILPLVSPEDIFIATNLEYKSLVRKQLQSIPEENILCEPVGRNTAPCIGLGAIHILKRYRDAIMIVLPSDHLIKYTDMFVDALDGACDVAEKGNNLVTLGIAPDYPETGYGYIKFDIGKKVGRAFAVERFVEKPDLSTAREYLTSEQYLWNSGMFIWKSSSIMENMKLYLPKVFEGLNRIAESIGTEKERVVLTEEFKAFPSVSVDYGIMEKAQDIYIVPGTFGWDDVGSWLAMERLNAVDEFGNILNGDIVSINTRNCIAQGNGKLLALVGMEDMIMIDTEDATLVCNKNATQDIKKVLENLRICGRHELL